MSADRRIKKRLYHKRCEDECAIEEKKKEKNNKSFLDIQPDIDLSFVDELERDETEVRSFQHSDPVDINSLLDNSPKKQIDKQSIVDLTKSITIEDNAMQKTSQKSAISKMLLKFPFRRKQDKLTRAIDIKAQVYQQTRVTRNVSQSFCIGLQSNHKPPPLQFIPAKRSKTF